MNKEQQNVLEMDGLTAATASLTIVPSPDQVLKIKLIQQQLVILLHAQQCAQRDRKAANVEIVCQKPHCDTIKDVLHHMSICNTGRCCTYRHCSSSRQLLAHCRNCENSDCTVCAPLKAVKKAMKTPLIVAYGHPLQSSSESSSSCNTSLTITARFEPRPPPNL